MSDTVKATPHLEGVYFRSITIKNFRCFGPSQTLELLDDKGNVSMWNVLLGENGTGKTTILRALFAMSLKEDSRFSGYLAPRILDLSTWRYDFEWWKRGVHERATLDGEYEWNGTIFRSGFDISNAGITTNSDAFNKNNNNQIHMTISAYGVNRRHSKEVSFRAFSVGETLFDSNAWLPSPEEWIAQVDYISRIKQDIINGIQPRDQVRELICDLLPDINDIKFDVQAGRGLTPRVEAKTPYGWVHLGDLSHGYQVALAWIIDLAARMIDYYPSSNNPFAEPAICLVDEIDLHMHPSWQKELVAKLQKIFEKTQFIVTAHSPLIVQAAEDANIVLLRREGDHVVIENDVDHIRNWRVDQILSSELFSNVGSESALSERLLKERTALVEKGRERTDAEEARLREIDKELDKLPAGTTAEDRDAMAIIRDAAEWLKANPKA